MKWAASVTSRCKWCTSRQMDRIKLVRYPCHRKIKCERVALATWIKWTSTRIMDQLDNRIPQWAQITCLSQWARSLAKDSHNMSIVLVWQILINKMQPILLTTTWKACELLETSGIVLIRSPEQRQLIMILIGQLITLKVIFSKSVPDQLIIASFKISEKVDMLLMVERHLALLKTTQLVVTFKSRKEVHI